MVEIYIVNYSNKVQKRLLNSDFFLKCESKIFRFTFSASSNNSSEWWSKESNTSVCNTEWQSEGQHFRLHDLQTALLSDMGKVSWIHWLAILKGVMAFNNNWTFEMHMNFYHQSRLFGNPSCTFHWKLSGDYLKSNIATTVQWLENRQWTWHFQW